MTDRWAVHEPAISDLIDESSHVGGIFSMEYDQCSILVNDYWTQEAGGLPRHTLLLARPMVQAVTPEEGDPTDDEWAVPGTDIEESAAETDSIIEEPDHAMLLRVKGPADLPTETRLKTNRHDAIRQTVTSQNGSKPSEEDVADLLTQREMQYSGISAKVLGTFYFDDPEDDEDAYSESNIDKILRYGSDIQNVFSAGNYIVYKLQDKALSWVASYPSHRSDVQVEIGEVKYTSTRIWDDDDRPSVSIPIEDFIGTKTALFGMTRTGKSNAMKILATAIEEANEKVGQLLFDPSGEYAYANDQDEKALADLGAPTSLYKFGAREGEDDFKPLRSDLLDPENIRVADQRVQQLLRGETSKYIKQFLTVRPPQVEDIISESNVSRKERNKRLHFAYLALLAKQLDLPPDRDFYREDEWDYRHIQIPPEMIEFLNGTQGTNLFEIDSSPFRIDNSTLVPFWEAIAEDIDAFNEKYKEVDGRGKNWVNEDLQKILSMFSTTGQSGHRVLSGLSKYHNTESNIDSAEKIYQDLEEGLIVVVDISNGSADVVEAETTRITNKILSKSMGRFKDPDESDEDLPNIQLYLEEAHQHFDTERYRNSEEQNPYVQLAKEGAKFNIGLTYATQEVTDIDPRVLSNTANWIITHLNSKHEINELGKYYNFEDFENSIRNVEDVGFARVKTRSGEYIIPAKISLFNIDWLAGEMEYDRDELEDRAAERLSDTDEVAETAAAEPMLVDEDD